MRICGCSSRYLDRDGAKLAAWPASTVNHRLRTRRLDPADFQVERPEQAAAAR